MAQDIVFCDLETYSEQEIKFGSFRYAQDVSTEIICLAYSFNGKETELWLPSQTFPEKLAKHIRAGGGVRSFNSTFEYAVLKYTGKKYGIPAPKTKQMFCTMTDALALALPGSLDACGEALGLDILKDKRGKRLITLLSKPRKATKNKPYTRITKDIEPELFQEFYDYCLQDVKSEIAIYNSLPRHIKDTELALFRDTLEINERGIPIDIDLVNAILRDKAEYEIILNKEIEDITCKAMNSTNSRLKALKWLKENGVELEGYTKKDIKDALTIKDLSEPVRRFLEVRSELSRTPIKKLDFVKKALCKDNTIKNNLIFHKATTGRFAGVGFQIQNLPRDHAEKPEELIEKFLTGEPIAGRNIYSEGIQLIRSIIAAPEKQKLTVSDFSSIENRVIAWLAGDYETLEDFKNGVDQYRKTATEIYNVEYEQVTKEQRQLGKIAVLSCGFGGGAKTFRKVCTDGWGIPITEEQAKSIVDGYRSLYKLIVKMWYGLYDQAMNAILNPGKVQRYNQLKLCVIGDFLYMRLPSGRKLAYYKPELRKVMTPWGKEKLALTHMGNNTYTRKWERLTVTPGRLTENATQAVARDVLTFALSEIDSTRLSVIASCHDEIIALGKEEKDLEYLDLVMQKVPKWAEGLPLLSEGYCATRYRK